MGVEGFVDAHVFVECHRGQVELLGHDEHFLEHFGAAVYRLVAVDGHAALFWPEQARDEVEQGALAGAVLAQQAIDVVGVELQVEVVEHFIILAWVGEADVIDVYHDECVFICVMDGCYINGWHWPAG